MLEDIKNFDGRKGKDNLLNFDRIVAPCLGPAQQKEDDLDASGDYIYLQANKALSVTQLTKQIAFLIFWFTLKNSGFCFFWNFEY